jgi:hypothetical protein
MHSRQPLPLGMQMLEQMLTTCTSAQPAQLSSICVVHPSEMANGLHVPPLSIPESHTHPEPHTMPHLRSVSYRHEACLVNGHERSTAVPPPLGSMKP